MSSYTQFYYHIVFGTKHHKPTIAAVHCELLYKYMWGIMQHKNCKLYRINGGNDHIHIFVDIPPKIGVADFVKDLKVSSSIWLKQQLEFKQFEGWAEGYGGFTISHSDKDRVIDYIKNQKQHHTKTPFIEEYRALLKEYGMELDENDLIKL